MSRTTLEVYSTWSKPPSLGDGSRDGPGPLASAASGGHARDPVVDGIREILAAAFIAVVAVSVCLEVSIGGRLAVAEALLLLALPWLVVSLRPQLDRTAWLLLAAAAIWLSALVLTDLVRGTEFRDFARGWARIGFLVVDFLAMYWLLTTPRRFLVWLLAFSVGIGLKALLLHTDPATQWKFGLGASVFFGAVAIVLLLERRGSPGMAHAPPLPVRTSAVAILALVGVAATVASLVVNARSAAAAFALSAMLLLLCVNENARARASRLIRRRWGVCLVTVLVFLYGFGRLYIFATETGWLGQEAQARLALQLLETQDPVFGLIGGGRGEFFASLRAIQDAPMIGHGSWARSAEYYGVYVDTLRRMGAAEMATIMEYVGRRDGHILPTHSHVLGAWVEAGIAGAAFWLVAAWMLMAACIRTLPAPTAIGLVLLCALPGQLWALAFSPLGADGRLFWALLFVGVCRIQASNDRPPVVGPFASAGALVR